MPNKLSQFWQELKRRNVVRVITVYGGAAFVILELVDMVREPFELPNWSFKLVIVLLSIGLIIAVILSWIYDIHPEGGVVKTEPASKVKKADKPVTSKGWKIASYISFVVIVGLIVLNIIPRSISSRKVLQKSIAVLPLDYLSEDPNKEYLANGVLEAITGNLSMIEGLRVMPRISVEQYRENRKSAKEIGEELDVSYLIEGSFQMVDDQVKLIIQLVVAEGGDHVFFKEYDREYKDILAVQSEVAQTIAREIEMVLTPEEKQRIEKIPTTDLTAYDFYQRGKEKLWSYESGGGYEESLERAEVLFNEALRYDSTFAEAYNGMAWVYMHEHSVEEYLSGSYLDSVLILTDKALSYNPNLSETYVIRGRFYAAKNNLERANTEFDKALQLNSNEWMAYAYKASLYNHIDFLETIKNFHKAIRLNRGQELPFLLGALASAYGVIGFDEQQRKYLRQRVDLTGDPLMNFYLSNSTPTNTEESLEYYQKLLRIDSSNAEALYQIAEKYSLLGNYQESVKYYEELLLTGELLANRYHRIGYAYWQNGDNETANYYFDKQIEYSLAEINLGRQIAGRYFSYYNLAGTYAFRGEKSKAYENLRMFNQKEKMPLWLVDYIKIDPLFDSIRDEPEFQQIVRDVEAKYQAEHERVRQWLEENDML